MVQIFNGLSIFLTAKHAKVYAKSAKGFYLSSLIFNRIEGSNLSNANLKQKTVNGKQKTFKPFISPRMFFVSHLLQ
ncbi:hypothetical protein DHB64_07995 [Antarcticibacterium sp. W02-3]|nr:hypothetical protein [Antarcticibacterium sp. W02-3]